MEKVSIIGSDLARNCFHLQGAAADGSVVFRKKLVRHKVLDFLVSQPNCPVAMEACSGAHWWGRGIMELAHEVRLVPPIYVKPFVTRQKNDASDAEAICEAATRPTMRFVPVKSEEQQSRCMVFRTRDLVGAPADAGGECAARSSCGVWHHCAAGDCKCRASGDQGCRKLCGRWPDF